MLVKSPWFKIFKQSMIDYRKSKSFCAVRVTNMLLIFQMKAIRSGGELEIHRSRKEILQYFPDDFGGRRLKNKN